MVKKFDM